MILNGSHLKKHKIGENIKNIFLVLKAYYRYFFKKKCNKVEPPKDYKLIFNDDFKNLNIDKKKWRLSQVWGDFHPDYLNQYYDTKGEMAYIDEEGLILEIKNKPKSYIKKDLPDWRQVDRLPDEFTIPIGVGMISSIQGWQYGWFESWIKIPRGKNYWLAFWLTGIENWPPEIDIFESYSKNGQYYNSDILKLKNFKIQPNLHYRFKNGVKSDYGSYDVPIYNVTKRFVQYVCHWERDFIRIYYDGQLVLETKNPKILELYNRPTDSMGIIINHGVEDKYHGVVEESKMIIRSVRVLQK